jgi:hypothetical protein
VRKSHQNHLTITLSAQAPANPRTHYHPQQGTTYNASPLNQSKMPSSVHSQDNDQSMVDVQPQHQEQVEQEEEEDVIELEEKRIIVVRTVDS